MKSHINFIQISRTEVRPTKWQMSESMHLYKAASSHTTPIPGPSALLLLLVPAPLGGALEEGVRVGGRDAVLAGELHEVPAHGVRVLAVRVVLGLDVGRADNETKHQRDGMHKSFS